jgi:pimeloyl-ACP methyl ester carboxylesterase
MPVVNSGGQQLYYELIDSHAPWRADPATILFHHGIGADSGIWAKWIGALVDQYQVVRFDMRGQSLLLALFSRRTLIYGLSLRTYSRQLTSYIRRQMGRRWPK